MDDYVDTCDRCGCETKDLKPYLMFYVACVKCTKELDEQESDDE